MSQPHLVLNLYAMSLLHRKRDLPPKQHLSANLLLSLVVIVSALQKSSHKDHLAFVAPQWVELFVVMMTFWAIEN